MTRNEILEIVLKSDSLPTLPSVATKLISLTSREETTITDIANLISLDISLSAKILKIANSAFYSFPNKISTINQAVSIIGTNAVRSLVLSFSFLSIHPKNKGDIFDYTGFWEHSLAAAVAAKLIMAELDITDPEEILIAGLLQNVGELVIARTLPDQYRQVKAAVAKGENLTAAEERIIGADHAFIGFKVAENWEFPEVLLSPIRHHHAPQRLKTRDRKLRMDTSVVYLSDMIANILYSERPQDAHARFIEKCGKILGFNEKTIDRILEHVHSEVTQVAKFFDLKIKETKSIEDILIEANAALSIINLSYEQMNKELVDAKVQLQKLTKDLEEKNKRLEKLANIDGLTEIYNHRYFQNFLEKEINRAMRSQTTLSLILADVDNFKKFNDNFGHQAGDHILRELCRLITSHIREYDLLARYGGEEFVLVLPETNIAHAETVAEKLKRSIAAHTFSFEYEKHSVTVSFGIAEMTPAKDSFTKSTFIDRADKAMLESKKKGRNRVTVHSPKKKIFKMPWG